MAPRLALLAAAATLALAAAPAAFAQLAPIRAYYGKDRAIPMTIAVPHDTGAEAEVFLFTPDGVAHARAAAAPGVVNLATLFPSLWTDDRPRVQYAQLVVGGEKVGAPVVLQPLITPQYAPGADPAGAPRFASDESRRRFSGLRAYADRRVVLETTKGEIELAMRPDAAPNTVWNFLQLVDGGFYTDLEFHRIVAADARGDGFIIQSGDPTGSGGGGPGYQIDLEPSTLPHGFGVVSMARLRSEPNSGGSQFFICLSRAGTSMLDGSYAAFAQTVRGGEVIQSIAAVPVGAGDRPLDPAPRIISARLVDAPPFGEGPGPVQEPGAAPIAR